MYYVNYDEASGEILGIYPSDFDYGDVPDPKIEITDAEWEQLGDGYWLVKNGALVQAGYSGGEGWNGDDGSDGYASDLQDEYTLKFESLKKSYTGALILDDTSAQRDIKRDYKRLLEEFREVQSAYVPDDSEHEHCEICGTVLQGGECPNCHWRQ